MKFLQFVIIFMPEEYEFQNDDELVFKIKS